MFKQSIEYDKMKTLEEEMRKENFFYDQNKNKRENIPNWKTKRHRKNTKLYKNTGNNVYWGYQGNNYKRFKPINLATKEREPPTTFNKNTALKEPLK